MKPLRLMFILASISMICILYVFTVYALTQNEAAVTVSWASQTQNAGEISSARITFISQSSETLTIYAIGLQFDWMEDGFLGRDLSDDPVVIQSQGSHTFDSMAFRIPPTVSAGSHSYFVGIDGFQGSSTTGFSWNSQTFMIQIGDLGFSELLAQVETKINEATNANYDSPDARSLLAQATNDFELAGDLADEGRLQEATSTLQNASDNLDQATLEEQRFDEQNQSPLLIIVAVIVVILVVSIIAVVVRKKRKQKSATDVQAPDQSNDQ